MINAPSILSFICSSSRSVSMLELYSYRCYPTGLLWLDFDEQGNLVLLPSFCSSCHSSLKGSYNRTKTFVASITRINRRNHSTMNTQNSTILYNCSYTNIYFPENCVSKTLVYWARLTKYQWNKKLKILLNKILTTFVYIKTNWQNH